MFLFSIFFLNIKTEKICPIKLDIFKFLKYQKYYFQNFTLNKSKKKRNYIFGVLVNATLQKIKTLQDSS